MTCVCSVGYHGSDVPTPNIDALASEGIRLEGFRVHRVCSPTRTAFMSGRYAWRNGLGGTVITNGHPYDLPLNLTTLPQVLKRGGPRYTAAFGKYDNGMTFNASLPTNRGFDDFVGYYDADQGELL